MARQQINNGTPNAGDGDTLYQAADKINDNFIELYNVLGPNGSYISQTVSFNDDGLVFNGNFFNTNLTFDENLSEDITLILPHENGTILTDQGNQDVINKTFLDFKLKTSALDAFGTTISLIDNNPSIEKEVTLDMSTLATAEIVLNQGPQNIYNKTLWTPIINAPSIQVGLKNTYNNNMITFEASTSNDGNIKVHNGTEAGISMEGNPDDVNMNLTAKGLGTININSMISFTPDIVSSATDLSTTTHLSLLDAAVDIVSPQYMNLPTGNIVGSKKQIINTNTGIVDVRINNTNSNYTITMRPDAIIDLTWTGTKWLINSPKIYTQSDNMLWYRN